MILGKNSGLVMCRESSCIKARIEVRYQRDCSIAHDALYIEDLKANS